MPYPEPPELIHTETINYTYSPDLEVKIPIRGTFFVMNMLLLISLPLLIWYPITRDSHQKLLDQITKKDIQQ